MSKRTILIVPLVALVLSCGTTGTSYVKEGVDYGAVEGVFRGRWWSYYERGVNLMRGGFYEAAATDFRMAIEGRSRDSWQARTYGLHFVEYFPNRELAVALQKMGRVDESQVYLERSLARIDTARAHHYLDLVKREQIARGSRADDTAPSLSTTLDDRILTADLDIALGISATDDSGVDVMRVNGEELYQRGSAEDISYEKTVSFDEGTHQITIEATDLADKVTTITREITVDLTGPTVGIREPEDALITEAASVRLIGTTVDVNGLNTIMLDDRVLEEAGQGQNRLGFDTALPLQDGENTFVLVASDRAGNETRTAIKVYKGRRETTAAKLWLIQQKHPEYLQVASTSPASLSLVLEALEAASEDARPEIRMRLPKETHPWRNVRAIRVAGTIISNNSVSKLVLHGEGFTEQITQLTGEPKESFDKRIPLKEYPELDGGGTVTFTVTVEAEDGEQVPVTKTITVNIEPIELDTRKSRMKMALLAFGGEAEKDIIAPIRSDIEIQIGATKRFNILERQQLAEVLSELQLSQALADPDYALQLGKIIPAHIYVVGQVNQIGQEAVVALSVVFTETSEKITFDSMIEDVNSFDSRKKGAKDLAEQLERFFPRLGGSILSVRGGKFLAGWTKEDLLVEGMHVWVLQQEEAWGDDDTGDDFGEGEMVFFGEGVIVDTIGAGTVVRFIESEEQVEFAAGMPIISM